MRRSSPSDKNKSVDLIEQSETRTSEHVNVMLEGDEYLDNSDDTVQLVRRDDNGHAIS